MRRPSSASAAASRRFASACSTSASKALTAPSSSGTTRCPDLGGDLAAARGAPTRPSTETTRQRSRLARCELEVDGARRREVRVRALVDVGGSAVYVRAAFLPTSVAREAGARSRSTTRSGTGSPNSPYSTAASQSSRRLRSSPVELGALVGEVRGDEAVADDEVVRVERGLEQRAGVEAVAGVEQAGQLRVHVVDGAERAVQVVGDGDAERVAVVEREAEERGRLAGRAWPPRRGAPPGFPFRTRRSPRSRRTPLPSLSRIRGRVRAVVTGGAGFIGSNLVDALLARGDEVVVVDDLSSGKAGERRRRPRGSSSSTSARPALAELFAEARPEVCFHLAAQADVPTSVRRPDFDAEVNVVGTVRVLQAAGGRRDGRLQLDRRRDLRRVRAARRARTTRAGRSPRTASRSSPARSTSPAGTGSTARAHATLRFANVYGPRQETGLEGGVVAIFLNAMAAGEETTIFGDGGQTRDFVHVDDVVRGAPRSRPAAAASSTSAAARRRRCSSCTSAAGAVSGDDAPAVLRAGRARATLRRSVARRLARRAGARLAARGRPRRRAPPDVGLDRVAPDALPRGRGHRADRRLRPRGDRRQPRRGIRSGRRSSATGACASTCRGSGARRSASCRSRTRVTSSSCSTRSASPGAALVAGSLGGRVALEVALARPDLVAALVLVGSGPARRAVVGAGARRFGQAEDEAVRRGDLDAATELNLRMWVDGPRRTPEDVDPEVREAVRVMQRRALELQAPVWDTSATRSRSSTTSPIASARSPSRRSCSPARRTSRTSTGSRRGSPPSIPGARSGTIPRTAHVPTSSGRPTSTRSCLASSPTVRFAGCGKERGRGGANQARRGPPRLRPPSSSAPGAPRRWSRPRSPGSSSSCSSSPGSSSSASRSPRTSTPPRTPGGRARWPAGRAPGRSGGEARSRSTARSRSRCSRARRRSVLVLNGNGVQGAAAQASAALVRARGYTVKEVGNAPRTGYARTIVMYRPGFRAEAVRFAHDLEHRRGRAARRDEAGAAPRRAARRDPRRRALAALHLRPRLVEQAAGAAGRPVRVEPVRAVEVVERRPVAAGEELERAERVPRARVLRLELDRVAVVPERGRGRRARPPRRRRAPAAGRSRAGSASAPTGRRRAPARYVPPRSRCRPSRRAARRRTARRASRARRRPRPTSRPRRPAAATRRSAPSPTQHAERRRTPARRRRRTPSRCRRARGATNGADAERERRHGRALVRAPPAAAPTAPRPPPRRRARAGAGSRRSPSRRGTGAARSCGSVVTIEPCADPAPRDLERRRALARRPARPRRATRPPATTSSGCSSSARRAGSGPARPPCRRRRRGTRRGSSRRLRASTTATRGERRRRATTAPSRTASSAARSSGTLDPPRAR